MSKQRYIDTRFWSDNWVVEELNPLDRYLFLYLLTNDKTNIAGVYEISVKTIANETGIDKEEVSRMIERLKPKVVYVDGWIVLKNFRKYQSKNPKIQRGIEIELEKAPEQIREIAYGYPMDRLSHSNSNSNSNGIDPVLNEPAEHKTFFKQPNPKKPKGHILAQAREICQIFSDHKGGAYNSTLHLTAAVDLLQLHGYDRVKEVALFAVVLTPRQFQVKIDSPVKLADKWPAVIELMDNPPKEESKYGIKY